MLTIQRLQALTGLQAKRDMCETVRRLEPRLKERGPMISEAECNIVRSMAALEEWLLEDENEQRAFTPQFRTPLAGRHDAFSVCLMAENDKTCFTYGRTLADALANAAQVVRVNPRLEE